MIQVIVFLTMYVSSCLFLFFYSIVHGSLVSQDLDNRDQKNTTSHKAKKIKMSPSHEAKHKVELDDHQSDSQSSVSEPPVRKDGALSNNNKNKKRYLR